MSSSFVVVGAGSIGAWIIEELLKNKATGEVKTLKILSRTVSLHPLAPVPAGKFYATLLINYRFFVEKNNLKSTNAEWFDQGRAQFVQVDYADKSTLAGVFEDIDVVFSTISATFIEQQKVIANAAKAAGVKLFVPSEYGIDTEDAEGDVFLRKKQFSDFLRDINLPFVKIFTGLWIDFCITP